MCFVKITRDVHRLNSWMKTWSLSFNTTKTKYTVRISTDKPHPNLNLNGVLFEQVHLYRHLGLIINQQMNNWTKTFLGMMYRSCILNHNRKMHQLFTITAHTKKKLEACQRTAALAYTKALIHSSTARFLNGLGWSKLEDRRTHFIQILLFNNPTPSYQRTLLPRGHGENINYPSRKVISFIPLRANTEVKQIVLPSISENMERPWQLN